MSPIRQHSRYGLVWYGGDSPVGGQGLTISYKTGDENMGIIEQEDIAAVWVGEELVCADCLSEDDETPQDKIVTKDEIEKDPEQLHFCDRCNKKI